MKNLKKITILALLTGLLFAMSSCVVLVDERKSHDRGHHWGWYKNPKNPHHNNPKHYEKDGKENGQGNKHNDNGNSNGNGKPKQNKHRG